ncbi:YtpI family protein [Bacillus weihaiensis]|uniref:YtpI family protein n=1 Tax=Bacillus weihaiensis TaxID=1547283 RepID=UPI0023521847|nr:YtpI family protein [Bacillus weihaiensis]
MSVFVALIIFSLAFYLFYRVKAYRSNKYVEKKWLSAKASIALGLFVTFFGVNQFFLNRSTISLVIGSIFILIGVASAWAGYRAYKHYLPQAIEEAKQQTAK